MLAVHETEVIPAFAFRFGACELICKDLLALGLLKGISLQIEGLVMS